MFLPQLLTDNLQSAKVKKSQVLKSVEALVSKGKITEKEYGKSKIYFLCQDTLEKPSKEEIAKLNAKADKLKQNLDEERTSLSSIKKELNALKHQMTDERKWTYQANYSRQFHPNTAAMWIEILEKTKALNEANKEKSAKLSKLQGKEAGVWRRSLLLFLSLFSLGSALPDTISKEKFSETKNLLQQNVVLWKKYKGIFLDIW